MEGITIAIVDDHALFRSGIAALLKEEGIKVLFEAAHGVEMQELIKDRQPDIILMDINMPVMDGFEATTWLAAHYPDCHVLALTMFADDKAILQMLKAGAKGYISKESVVKELLRALQAINTKGLYLNDNISGRLLHSMQKADEPILSAKEQEFLIHCCSELTYKEIADKMNVSPRTVDNYRDAIFMKLQLKSRSGMLLYAIKNRLFSV